MASKNTLLFIALLSISHNHASSNRFASWLAFFQTKISALKNYVSTFKSPRFDFKNWFFKRRQSTVPQQQPLPSAPIEKQLEIIDLTTMEFSDPKDPIDTDKTELTNLINQTKIRPVLAHYIAILDKKWKELATDFKRLLSLNPDKSVAGKYLLTTFNHEQKEYLKKPYDQPETLKKVAAYPLRQFAKMAK